MMPHWRVTDMLPQWMMICFLIHYTFPYYSLLNNTIACHFVYVHQIIVTEGVNDVTLYLCLVCYVRRNVIAFIIYKDNCNIMGFNEIVLFVEEFYIIE